LDPIDVTAPYRAVLTWTFTGATPTSFQVESSAAAGGAWSAVETPVPGLTKTLGQQRAGDVYYRVVGNVAGTPVPSNAVLATIGSIGVPTITSITPATGALGGGTSVTIAGTNLFNANMPSTVTIGAADAPVTSGALDGTSLTVTTPGGAGGVDVVVAAPGGSVTSSLGFTYTAAPPAPSTPPGEPRSVGAVGGLQQISVSWAAPAANGNPAPTSYTATAWTAATGGTLVGTCSAAASPCTVTGLKSGTGYFVDVVANNGVNGPASAPRVAVTTTAMVPSAPLSVTAESGTQGYLTWAAPLDPGNAQGVTSYTIQMSANGGTTWTNVTTTAGIVTLTRTVTNLNPAVTYQFRIAARNAVGLSAWTPVTATRIVGQPTAPTSVVATAGATAGTATLNWVAPAPVNGTIFGYRIQASRNGGGWTTLVNNTGSAVTTRSLTAITPAGSYRFRVAAINVNGRGTNSGASVAVAIG
jgi:hypothetical protein